jgi:transcriptional regulator with XRE-family HTH domain
LRNKFGLTQEYISQKIGVSRPTLNKIESGKAEISLLQAKKLADFYNLPLENLLSGEDSMQNQIRTNLSNQVSPAAQSEGTNAAKALKDRIPANPHPAYRQDLTAELILYLCSKLMALPQFSEVNLKQLLFLLEVTAVQKLGYSLTGLRFLKNAAGPEPLLWQEQLTDMAISKLLLKISNSYFKFPEQKYLPLRPARLELFTVNEYLLIDDIIYTAGSLPTEKLISLIKEVELYQKAVLYKEIALF